MWSDPRSKTCHTGSSRKTVANSVMPGPCSHQFVWPRRASDGRYYQVCRHCEAEYEYDWESMSRLPSGDPAGADTASTAVRIGQSSGGSTTTLTPEVMIRSVKVREVPPL